MQAETTRYAVAIPHAGSLILTHSWDGQIPALKDFPPADRPNATIVFWTFRGMVGLGLLMLVLAIWGLALRRGARLYARRAFLRFALAMSPAGILAILLGWMTTEIGRQPWVVYGLQRTADAVSPHPAGELALTLAIFVVVYIVAFGAGTAYALRVMTRWPPQAQAGRAPAPGDPGPLRRPMRPLSGARAGRAADSDPAALAEQDDGR
jgi:cytochrome d ubiquinol oxidase subunit I